MKISLITVSFNSGAHIADALRSVDRQRGVDVEHWVIDGASTDATQAIVAAHPQPWRRMLCEPDRGIYDAMNKGLALVTGDVVGFINSDDVLADEHVLARYAEAFEDPALQAVHRDLVYTDRRDLDRVLRYWRGSDWQPDAFERGWVPAHPTFYARRSVYEAHGGFDLSFPLAADFEIMCRFLHAKRICSRYLPGVAVRMRAGGATNVSWRNIWRQNVEIVSAMRRHSVPVGTSFIGGKLASRTKQWLARSQVAGADA